MSTQEQSYYTLGERATELYFADDTPRAVAEAIHKCYTYRANTDRANGRIRIRVWYGDPETGRAWLEENDVTGYIGRSTGRIKIPLLVHNSGSYGGGALLASCIVKIQSTCKDGRVWYEHPTFDAGMFRIGGAAAHRDHVPVWHKAKGRDWEHVANFDTWEKAERYTGFMVGRRMRK